MGTMGITLTKKKLEMLKMDDIVGKKIGKRTVLCKHGKNSSREWMYLCRCECGSQDVIRGNALRNGLAGKCKSCSAALTKNRTSHGVSKTPIYQSWKAMQNRCYVESNPSYKHYGARGIQVCNEWKDPAKFYEWAVANGWGPNLSIDRINVDLGYFPENCRWASSQQQTENKRLITKANKSGYSGVSKRSFRDVWLARISVGGKLIHLGHYKTPISAALSRDKYVIKHGLKRPLNFTNYEVEAREAEREPL